jgi:[glutamine synthetase] adenylyltransferase / [glutamine synthetase]-adenylyl-L-tyrosine phosphorylase
MLTLSPSSATALPRPHDPARTAREMERWLQAIAALEDAHTRTALEALSANPDVHALLASLFGHSPHLTWCLLREPATFLHIAERGVEASFADLMDLLAEPLPVDETLVKPMRTLRQIKRRAALIIGLADILGHWGVASVTDALTSLAEQAVGRAIDVLLQRAINRGDLTIAPTERPSEASGFIILGMGKLGARELNYSSDIDLILLYDDDRLTSSKPDKLQQICVRIARDLVRMMEERTGDGYVFRTDLRLRPDPGSTPLVVSTIAAETYYESIGQNWERAAMIKARPIAGDISAGKAFLRTIRPFVWRRSLDFNAIRDVHAMKRQINEYSLKDKGRGLGRVNGFNVKLGRGGIREIEFFVQTQQLIYGGREPTLRTSGTIEGLWALVRAHRLPERSARELTQAYQFLRTVEHRIQMVDDAQTHLLPDDDDGVARIAGFLGYDGAEPFRAALLHEVDTVRTHYAALFEEQPRQSTNIGNLLFTGGEDDPDTLASLSQMGFTDPSKVAALVRGWLMGRYRCTRSERARELLTEVMPALLHTFGTTLDPDGCVVRFDRFLSALPAGIQLFSLFQRNPQILTLMADIMGTSLTMSEYMARQPDTLEGVLTPGYFDSLPSRQTLEARLADHIGQAGDFQDVLTICQRFSKDYRFQAGLHALLQTPLWEQCGAFRTDVAEVAMAALLPAIEADFSRRHGTMPAGGLAVIGMGKLGARELTARSDLDMVLVYEPAPEGTKSDGARPLSAYEYFIKLSQRFVSALTAQSGDGQLYEVDLRLRPAGKASPPAVSLEAFITYHRTDSWTWEHMALTRARVVAGSPSACKAAEKAIHAILTRPRDPDALLADVASMRQRVDKEYATTNIWAVKYVRGGMMDIEFITQYLLLRHAAAHPEVLTPVTADALTRLEALGLLAPTHAQVLRHTHALLLRLQAYQRITHGSTLSPDAIPPALKRGIALAVSVAENTTGSALTFAAAEALVRAHQAATFAVYSALIDIPAAALPPPAEISHDA